MSSTGVSLFHAALTAVLGVLLLLLPRIGRRGLLFGVYVGEAAHDAGPARDLRRRWTWATGLVAAIAVGGALACGPLGLGRLAPFALFVLLLGFSATYLRAHFTARGMAAETRAPAVASLAPAERRTLLPALVLPLVLVTGGLVLGHAIVVYADLPQRVPVHFDASGAPDAWSDKSPAAVLLLPFMTLTIGGFIAWLAVLMTGAKRSLRHPHTAVSLEAQTRFRTAVTRFLCGIAVLTTALLAALSLGQIEVARGGDTSVMLWGGGLAGLLMAVYAIGGAIYLLARYGQGGARLERQAMAGTGTGAGELTDGLADNRLWKLGVFYVNRDDPAMFVEKRFGLGYTINLGNPRAVALIVGFLLVITVVLTVAFTLD